MPFSQKKINNPILKWRDAAVAEFRTCSYELNPKPCEHRLSSIDTLRVCLLGRSETLRRATVLVFSYSSAPLFQIWRPVQL